MATRNSMEILALGVLVAGVIGCVEGGASPVAAGGGGLGGASSGAGGAGGDGAGAGAVEEYDWGLPPGYPRPKVPADNPMSEAKVALGRHLFHDERLSSEGTYACASCHRQELAFSDGLAHAVGVTGEVHPRSSMSLVNAGYLSVLTWANPLLHDLAPQALIPMFGEDPIELGLVGMEEELLERLAAEPIYLDLFPRAFPDDPEPIDLQNITRALASFQRAILSYRSPYDRYAYGGDPSAMTAAALRGRDLFFSEKLECFHCHGGFNFSDSVTHDGSTFTEVMFHNTGLYNVGGTGAYPPGNGGVYEITSDPEDMGRFRAPTLRNIAVTAPYMHDGSIATLDEVLDHYAAGGRTLTTGPYAGVGSDNPYKSELINGFSLTPEERADVLAFLASLTDSALLEDPRFADPWKEGP
jgi:cytochrome c peroxidase